MPPRDANRRGDRVVRQFGDGIRELRTAAGLGRRELAEGIGISESKLARWEKALEPFPDLREAAILMRMLGQDLVLSWYPADAGLRDAAHVRLVAAFLALLPSSVPRRLEAAIPNAGDLRAWDVLFAVDKARVGVAVETRLRDWQALLRRELQKARDSGVDRLLLVLLDSHPNHRSVAEAGAALREALPLDGRAILPALRAGRDIGGNGLLFLRLRDSAPRPRWHGSVAAAATRSWPNRQPVAVSTEKFPLEAGSPPNPPAGGGIGRVSAPGGGAIGESRSLPPAGGESAENGGAGAECPGSHEPRWAETRGAGPRLPPVPPDQ